MWVRKKRSDRTTETPHCRVGYYSSLSSSTFKWKCILKIQKNSVSPISFKPQKSQFVKSKTNINYLYRDTYIIMNPVSEFEIIVLKLKLLQNRFDITLKSFKQKNFRPIIIIIIKTILSSFKRRQCNICDYYYYSIG